MNESNMQHGVDWTGGDLTGWHISEKFDGCRAYWDGCDLWSRGGMKAQIPEAWRAALPVAAHLDCELYDGVDGVYRCGAALRYGRFTETMRLMVFDAPRVKGYWPERMQGAAAILSGNAVARCVEHRVCTGLNDAFQELARVRQRGGEGLMFRAPGHRYTVGIARDVIKFKTPDCPRSL